MSHTQASLLPPWCAPIDCIEKFMTSVEARVISSGHSAEHLMPIKSLQWIIKGIPGSLNSHINEQSMPRLHIIFYGSWLQLFIA
ncbi:hypothetical protein SUGI_1098060 [Cryptomeria japonica]|nr:hypothetical protein SUGI_1098060 [Cryptomeria japonica]